MDTTIIEQISKGEINMYNALVIFCLIGATCMLLWGIGSLKEEIIRRSDAKSDERRAYSRKYNQEAYRKDYWIRKNREDAFTDRRLYCEK